MKPSKKTLPTSNYRILLSGCWPADRVVVNEIGGRKEPVDEPNDLNAFWRQKIRENPALFNGELAALVEAAPHGNHLELTLSATTYRYLLYSNSKAETWRRRGQHERLSRALGISAVVECTDHRLMLMHRSRAVGEYPDRLDVFGGHVDMHEHRNASGRLDVFLAIRDELRCELGVDDEAIQHTYCIGLAENLYNFKPELIFWTRLSLTSEEVRSHARYGSEAGEFVRLVSIPFVDFQRRAFSDFRPRLTPSAEASLALFRRFHRTRGAEGSSLP